MGTIYCNPMPNGMLRAAITLDTSLVSVRTLGRVMERAVCTLHPQNAASYQCKALPGNQALFSIEINPHLSALTQVGQLTTFAAALEDLDPLIDFDMSALRAH